MSQSLEERRRKDREYQRRRYHEDPEFRAAKDVANREYASAHPELNTEYVRRKCLQDAEFHERRKKTTRAWRARHSKLVKAFVAAAKDQPCVDCGLQYPPCCMEFDHVRGTKIFGISRLPVLDTQLQKSRQRLRSAKLGA